MAVTELWQSEELHVTSEGTDAQREWSALWTDVYTWVDDLPQIGDFFHETRQDLICTDINVKPIDNTNVIVTATFSTEAKVDAEEERPDQAASWKFNISAQADEQVVSVADASDGTKTATYRNAAGTVTDWLELWNATNPTKAAPDLILHKRKIGTSMTIYGSGCYVGRMLAAIGKVNSTQFMSAWLAVKRQYDTYWTDDFTIANDTGMWLFSACEVTRIRAECYQFDLTFLYDGDGWNNFEGIATGAYGTTNFNTLYSGMTYDAPVDDITTGRGV